MLRPPRTSPLAAALLLAGCSPSLNLPWAGSNPFSATEFSEEKPAPTPTPTPFTFDAGDGHDGAGNISGGNTVLNVCRVVLGAADMVAVVENAAGFLPGMRLVLLQMQGAAAASGDDTPFSGVGSAGQWDLVRVASIAGTTLVFESPVRRDYLSDSAGGFRAQACSIPEFASLSLQGGAATIAASPWDGSTGGFVGMLVQDTFNLVGIVDASDDGFRGGSRNPAGGAQNVDVTTEDTASNDGGGKGDGVDARSFTLFGKGNLAHAGGGGNARKAGGGGGGNAGAGGFGGKQVSGSGDEPLTRGRGGSAMVVTSARDRLLMGGGGGAGHSNSLQGGQGSAGGGIVLIMAGTFTGNGRVFANGDQGGGAGDEGAGGGGAGGTILAGATSFTFTGDIDANGGRGGNAATGNANSDTGPGGGGGGGRVLLIGAVQPPTVRVIPGGSGTNGASGNDWGAEPGLPGVIEP